MPATPLYEASAKVAEYRHNTMITSAISLAIFSSGSSHSIACTSSAISQPARVRIERVVLTSPNVSIAHAAIVSWVSLPKILSIVGLNANARPGYSGLSPVDRLLVENLTAVQAMPARRRGAHAEPVHRGRVEPLDLERQAAGALVAVRHRCAVNRADRLGRAPNADVDHLDAAALAARFRGSHQRTFSSR